MKAELKIKAVENGFIVITYNDDCHYKSYAFETAEAMAELVAKWGRGTTKTTCIEPTGAKG